MIYLIIKEFIVLFRFFFFNVLILLLVIIEELVYLLCLNKVICYFFGIFIDEVILLKLCKNLLFMFNDIECL